MWRVLKFCLLASLFVFALTGSVRAQVTSAPPLLNFQGRLARPDGTPVVDGTYSLRFSLWNAASGGTEKWNQTFGSVSVRNGAFAALLNAASPANLFDGDLWLEIKVGNDAPLAPRQQLVTVAYALKANTVPDGSITNTKIASGTLTADRFAPNALNTLSWLLGGNSGTNGTQFLGTTDSQPLVFRTNNTEKMRLLIGGHLGIGTNNPGYKLDVVGTIHGNNASDPGVYGQSDTYIGVLGSSSANYGVTGTSVTSGGVQGVSTSGYGVIGNSASSSGVYGINSTSQNYGLLGNASNGTSGYAVSAGGAGVYGSASSLADFGVIGEAATAGSIGVRALNNSGGYALYASGNAIAVYGTSSSGAGFGGRFANTGGGVALKVDGRAEVSLLRVLGGSDVAEPYDVASAGNVKPIPGMVVCIDPERVGRMLVASAAYDTTVAGIVSGANGIQPGIMLRQEGTVADGALPVASIGRVWCWCDADASGPIKAGDLLTTSDTPGHAMRVADSNRANGAVIGKAMSSLKSGKGLVLVLVSLK